MNFDELLKIVTSMKAIPGEDCLICHFPIDNPTNMIELSCKHIYHKECLEILKNYNNITCPYCQSRSKISTPKNKTTLPYINCSAILKTGVNKGSPCGKNNCKRHNNLNLSL